MTDKTRKSDAEWRAQLSDLAYRVTRRKGTERAFTHDDFPKGPAVFHCVCCGAPLFDAAAKYDSGTGWPSFYAPIAPDAVEEHADWISAACAAPRSPAPAATPTSATCSATGPTPPACATA